MSKLRPTLWRTCRVLACETRLQLLWLLFGDERRSVAELAEAVGVSPQNASIQLRALSSRGLISPHREKLEILYRPEVNDDVAHARTILDALRKCAESGMSHETVIRQATAFTHLRRILLVRALDGKHQKFEELHARTGISPTALSKHLVKLEARGFVKNRCGEYRLTHPGNSLGRVLLKVARS